MCLVGLRFLTERLQLLTQSFNMVCLKTDGREEKRKPSIMAPIRQPGDANSFSMEHMGKITKKLNPRNVGVPDNDKQELFSYNIIFSLF